MAHGLSVYGEAGNLVLDESAVTYEYIGKFIPIAHRMPSHSALSFLSNPIWAYTHYVDVYTSNRYPLVFMEIPSGPSVGVTGNGAAVLGSKDLGNGSYRIFLAVTVGTPVPLIRCFGELKFPSGETHGLRIVRSDYSLVFDSGKNMLWVAQVGEIELKASYSDIANLDEAEPTKNSQVAITGLDSALGSHSISCNTRPLCYRAGITTGWNIFYHWVFSHSGNTLQGRWARTYTRISYGPTVSNSMVVADSTTFSREFALIENSYFP